MLAATVCDLLAMFGVLAILICLGALGVLWLAAVDAFHGDDGDYEGCDIT